MVGGLRKWVVSVGERNGASKDVQPQQRGLWLVVLEDKLLDSALRDRLSVKRWGLEQRLCHVTLEVAATSDTVWVCTGRGILCWWSCYMVAVSPSCRRTWHGLVVGRGGVLPESATGLLSVGVLSEPRHDVECSSLHIASMPMTKHDEMSGLEPILGDSLSAPGTVRVLVV